MFNYYIFLDGDNNTLSPSIMEKIYKLIDPITLDVKYIGYTKNPIKKRLKNHIRDSINNNRSYKQKWIRSLLKEGKLPIIKVVKYIRKDEDWEYYEKYYISKYREKMGSKLTNGTEGGDGGKLTPSIIKKIADSRKGSKMSDESKELMRKAKIGKIGKDCPNSKGLIAYNDKEELFFWSAFEAQEYFRSKGLKANKKNISACLRGSLIKGKYLRTKVAGYKFKKYEKK